MNNNAPIMNEDELDCLQEFMNIAFGSANAAITEIVGNHSTLTVPSIDVIDIKDLKSKLILEVGNDSKYFVASQLLNGEFSGENLFAMEYPSAVNLAKEFELEDDEINDSEISEIILEVTNILSSSTIGNLVKQLDSYVTFSPPAIKLIGSLGELDESFLQQYSKVIIITTELNFEEQHILGKLIVLTKGRSIEFLKDVINKILEEY
jgi:chemotaxis protein CheC